MNERDNTRHYILNTILINLSTCKFYIEDAYDVNIPWSHSIRLNHLLREVKTYITDLENELDELEGDDSSGV